MTNIEASTDVPPPNPRANAGARLLGLMLFLPAVLCCLGTLAWPTLSTLLLSLREGGVFEPGEFVGLQNYSRVLGLPAFRSAAGFTLLLALMRAVIVGIVPLVLALGLQGLGAVPRWLTRLAATIPTALYLPGLIALAWMLAVNPAQGLLPPPEEGGWLSSPGRARLVILLVDAVYVLVVSVALGLAAYLAALRAQANGRQAWGPLLAVLGIGVLAALASGLQTIALPLAMTRGGPADSTTTLALLLYNLVFVRFDLGVGATVAVLLLVALMVLGFAATLVMLAGRLRLAVREPATGGGVNMVPLLILGLLLAGPACLAAVGIPAWAAGQGAGGEAGGLGPISTARVLANTLLPPIPIVLLQVGVAWLGALGVSGLRPLGRSSEWLLLLFAPWLFVTLGPVSLAHFNALREAESLNTLAGLLPPLRLSVPMLFVLALFFRGQVGRWQAAEGKFEWGDFSRRVLAPSLPLAGLLFVLGWLAGVQEVLWPLLTSQSSEFYTANVVALVIGGSRGVDGGLVAELMMRLGLPLFALFAVLLGVFQVTLLDRLVVTSGDEAGLSDPAP